MAPLVEQRDASPLPNDTAVCLGAFDGLHLGHQALLARARTHASRLGLVTFDPHPQQVLAPRRAPVLLHTPVRRRRVCSALGVQSLVLLPFDQAMAQMSATQFVRTIFIEGLRPTAIVIGDDFRFGRDREGSGATLRQLLSSTSIQLDQVAAVPVPMALQTPGDPPDLKLSTTAIRHAIEHGHVERAGLMLGHWHAVAGTVERGAQRGRTIGFPTANIHVPDGFLPPAGVYAGMLSVWSPGSTWAGQVWPAVANLGKNPTFVEHADAAPLSLEAHVLDQSLGDTLYGLDVEFSFVARLRDERRFDGADALVKQLRLDVNAARPRLEGARARVIAPSSIP